MSVIAKGIPGGNAHTRVIHTYGTSSSPSPIIFQDSFDSNPFSGSVYFETDTAGGDFAWQPSGGVDGGPCMKAHYQAGGVSEGSLHLAFGKTPTSYFTPVDAGTAIYTELYWRFYFKCNAGWQGGQQAKMTRALGFVSGNFNSFVYAVTDDAANTNILGIDPSSGTDTAGHLKTTTYNDFANERFLGNTNASSSIFASNYVGQWFCIEHHVKLNTPGVSDGLYEVYINDVKEINLTGLNWRGDPSVDATLSQGWGFNAVYLENFSNSGAPQAQDRFFDKFVVSTAKIGL